MEALYCISLALSFLFISYKLILRNRVQHKNLPPCPPSLPILGHFHLLKKPLHHALQKISNQYGPILFLRFGQRPVLVVSTPSAVEECFSKNDIIFSNRPLFQSRRRIEYNFTSMGMAPYGHHWRNLRRFTALEIFSSTRLQMSSSIRTDEIRYMTKKLYIGSCNGGSQKVDMKLFFYILTYNIVMKMVTGNRYFDEYKLDSDENRGKYDHFRLIFNPTGMTPLGDFFPFLRWLTYYGEEKKMEKLRSLRDSFMQDLIDQHRINKSSTTDGVRKQTIIDILLSLQESEPEFYNDDMKKGIITIMMIAGTESSTLTMDSAVSQLISCPDAFKKAREEIDTNIGHARLLEDSDIENLMYLNCIINETLRLGPVGPIIPPRESSEECTVGGFDIPSGTMLLVNAWAMQKDPNVWEDPDVFKPGRFEGNEGSKGGFKFLPFGCGRRKCPGEGLAMRLMALGTLIQCFDWEKTRETGLDTAMEKPVEVVFRPRETLIDALSQL